MNSLLVKKLALYLAWIQAWAGLMGSLFFSEILKYPPCVLCWYQRICLYPIVAILTVGIIRKDQNVPYYVLPFGFLGMAIAFYHNLLYYNIIPESSAQCAFGISCTTRFVEWFGFVTIPLLSFLAFALITSLMLFYLRFGRLKK